VLSLTYALFAGLAVDRLFEPDRIGGIRKLAAGGVFSLLLIIAAAWTWPIWGWQGQLRPTFSREGWSITSAILARDNSRSAALFLPWHQYMGYSWLPQSQKLLKVPADHFFSNSMIVPRNTEFGGIYSSELANPMQRAIENLMFIPEPRRLNLNLTRVGEKLSKLNIGWVILVKEADYQLYETLLEQQTDLVLILDRPSIRLYRNLVTTYPVYRVPTMSANKIEPVPNSNVLPVFWKIDSRVSKGGGVTFVPPNSDGRAWTGSVLSLKDTVTLNISGNTIGRVWFWPFAVNLLSWAVTLATGIATGAGLVRGWRHQF